MKFFVVSDIHGFYDELITALDKAGFDEDNKEHWLISCGDEWDRGPKPVEVMKFLNNLERKTLIRGNHMYLLEELCMRQFPYSHDKHNGTFKTVISFGNFDGYNFDECCVTTLNKTARYRELLVNYFETQNYIFVHSWIPTSKKERLHPADKWITLTTNEYMEDWRNANDVEWEEAMWGNPFKLADIGLNQTGKTIVFGHFHTSYAHSRYTGTSEFGEDANFDIYYGKDHIGLDACTAYTGKINVLVLEDEFLEG